MISPLAKVIALLVQEARNLQVNGPRPLEVLLRQGGRETNEETASRKWASPALLVLELAVLDPKVQICHHWLMMVFTSIAVEQAAGKAQFPSHQLVQYPTLH